MLVSTRLEALGGVARVAQLLKLGHTEPQIRAAVRAGAIGVVRHGWLRTANAPDAVVRAVEVGGRLGCVSAAAHLGLWTVGDTRLHIAMPTHAGHHVLDGSVDKHWTSENWRSRPEPIESIPSVLRQMLLCQDRESAITTIDSALNQLRIEPWQVRQIIDSLPADFQSVVEEVDGASQSGLESLSRIRLRRHGLKVTSQALVAGARRDLKIGDRLLIEADGRAWHDGEDRFLIDRSRDLVTARRGYVTLRPAPQHILHEWPWFESVVMGMVERQEHLWSAAQRRDPRCDGYGG